MFFYQEYLNVKFSKFEDVIVSFFHDAGLYQQNYNKKHQNNNSNNNNNNNNDYTVLRVPYSACFAVAGPVINDTVRFTNREGWVINADQLSYTFNIPRVRCVII